MGAAGGRRLGRRRLLAKAGVGEWQLPGMLPVRRGSGEVLAAGAVSRSARSGAGGVWGAGSAAGKPRRGSRDRGSPIKPAQDRKSTRLNSSHSQISYAVFCLKKKKEK